VDFGILQYNPRDLVLALAWSPQGDMLAVAAGENVHLVDARTLAELRVLPVGAWVGSLAFKPDGTLLSLAVKDGSVQLWDPATGQLRCRLEAHHPSAKSVAFSPDGRWLASTGNDAYVRLWDITTLPAEGECDMSPVAEMIGGALSVPLAAFSPDGKVIASVDSRRILLREVSSQRLIRAIQAGSSIFSLAYNPDGSQLVSGELGNTIHIWDVASGERLQEMNWPGAVNRIGSANDYISSVAINPKGNLLAAGSSDARVTLWDFPGGQFLLPFHHHTLAVTCVAFSPNGHRLASGSLDATVLIEPLDLP
jgi:WD40 repeat protein